MIAPEGLASFSRKVKAESMESCSGSSGSNVLENRKSNSTPSKQTLLAYIFTATFSIFGGVWGAVSGANKAVNCNDHGWTNVLRSLVVGTSLWRLHRLLEYKKANYPTITGEVWLLGRRHMIKPEECSSSPNLQKAHSAFLEDFSSRIWITYRKDFEPIDGTYFTSDVNWGCIIRSSQMLIAQALLCHHFGRSWVRPLKKPYHPEYIKILHLFGDATANSFSIHNLVQAGKNYGLAAGLWVGPYAMSRAWESLICSNKEHRETKEERRQFPMAVYVVSGDQDGESGGAPVVCIDVATKLCADDTGDQSTWEPVLLLVPLVLGLGKVNPRYIPLLKETFTFPQSLGIVGGKPASSTYIVGIHGDNALYLDPHQVQTAVNIDLNDLEADTSSYHCGTVREVYLEQLDPSLALGFYCRDRADFEDFCSRATALENKANGAPLFTTVQSFQPRRALPNQEALADSAVSIETFCMEHSDDSASLEEDDWEIL